VGESVKGLASHALVGTGQEPAPTISMRLLNAFFLVAITPDEQNHTPQECDHQPDSSYSGKYYFINKHEVSPLIAHARRIPLQNVRVIDTGQLRKSLS
jgi:hypothetical protein